MQEKCKTILTERFPNVSIREKENQLLFNVPILTGADLDALSHTEGMCKDISIKRSGTGLVVILFF